MALTPARIRILGDSSQAQAAMQGVSGGATRMGGALANASRSAATSSDRMANLALKVTGVNQAFGLLRRGLGTATRAFSVAGRQLTQYLDSTEEGTATLGGFRDALRDVRNEAIENALGVEDAAEANEFFRETMGLALGTLGEMAGMLHGNREEASALAREGIAVAVDAMASLVDAGAIVINTGRSLEIGYLAVKVALLEMGAATVQVTGLLIEGLLSAFQAVTGAAAGTEGRLNSMIRTFVPVIGILSHTLPESAREGLGSLSDGADAARQAIADFRQEVAEGTGDAVTGAGERIGELGDAMLETSLTADELSNNLRLLAEGVRTGTVTEVEFEAAVRRGNSALQDRAVLMGDHIDRIREELQAARELRDLQLKEEEALVREAQNGIRDRAIEQAQILADHQQAEIERIKGGLVPALEEANAARLKAKDAVEGYATSMLSAFSSVVSGQQSAGDAAKAVVADTLNALAAAALAQSLMIAFQVEKGGPVVAGLLAGAAIAAKGVAAAISPGGGGGGSSAPAPSAVGQGLAPVGAAPQATNNTTIVNNFGIRDGREAQRQAAVDVRGGIARGYLPSRAIYGVA